MRIGRLILAMFMAIWTVGVGVGFGWKLGADDDLRNPLYIAGGVVAVLICAAVTIWLFRTSATSGSSTLPPPDDLGHV